MSFNVRWVSLPKPKSSGGNTSSNIKLHEITAISLEVTMSELSDVYHLMHTSMAGDFDATNLISVNWLGASISLHPQLSCHSSHTHTHIQTYTHRDTINTHKPRSVCPPGVRSPRPCTLQNTHTRAYQTIHFSNQNDLSHITCHKF